MKRSRFIVVLVVMLVLLLFAVSTATAGPVPSGRDEGGKAAPGGGGATDLNTGSVGAFGIEVDMDTGEALFVTEKGERLNPSDEIIVTGDFLIAGVACLDCTGGGPAPGTFRTIEIVGTYVGPGLPSAAGPATACAFAAPSGAPCWYFSDLATANYGIVVGDFGAPGIIPGMAPGTAAGSTWLSMGPMDLGPCASFGFDGTYACEMAGAGPGPWPFTIVTHGVLGPGATFSIFFDVCDPAPAPPPSECGVYTAAGCPGPPGPPPHTNWISPCPP